MRYKQQQPTDHPIFRSFAQNMRFKIHNSAIPVTLQRCTSWFLILKDLITDLGISENRVLKQSFEPKGQKVAGGWRKLHDEQLNDF